MPWCQLEEYLEAHQNGLASMQNLLKLGLMEKSDIEEKLPKLFLQLYHLISKILKDNGIAYET